MTYDVKTVLRALPSVLDKEGFYLRGAKHPPRNIPRDEYQPKRGQGTYEPFSEVCEVLDVERAIEGLTVTEMEVLERGTFDPAWISASEDRLRPFIAIVQKIANRA